MQRVLIVGAGLAGSALAVALGRRGIPVDVVDLDARTVGAHIGLTNRAVDVLADLGVLEAVSAAGHASQDTAFIRIYTATGDLIPVPPPPRPDTDLPAMVGIYRPALSEILVGAAKAAGANFRDRVTVDRLAQDADGVDVAFSDGTDGRYGLVVGADGVHSRVRELWFPALRPTYTGVVALRTGVARLAEDHLRAQKLADGLRHASGLQVLTPRPITNFVLVDVSPSGQAAEDVVAGLKRHGISASSRPPATVRFVTHRQITDDDVATLIKTLAGVVGDGHP